MSERNDKRKGASAETLAAAEEFVKRTQGTWTARDESQMQARLQQDESYRQTLQGVENSWQSFSTHAETPEMMALRESALAWIRQKNARRWAALPARRGRLWAIAAAVLMMVALAVQFSPYGYHPNDYRTEVGQRQDIALADHSLVSLDAATRMRVEYSDDTRMIQLIEGQARFSVAEDPKRPFIVQAGPKTIVALGTVFTVEHIGGEVHVALLEGKVAVKGGKHTIELSPGEALKPAPDGAELVVPKADIAAATAWLEGKVIFRDEPLGDAVRRMNRYSTLKLEISDPALAALRISGVFEANDADAFAHSVEGYYDIVADTSKAGTVLLRGR